MKHVNTGYSTSTFHGQEYVRTQRSAQFRWALMAIGAATLGTAGSLAYNTFTNEYQQARSLAETAVVAQQVAAYKPEIAEALEKSDALAARIGSEVADPAVTRTHSALRRQARTLLNQDVVVPTREDGAQLAAIDRDVADSMLAVNAAMVKNLSAAEEQLVASHEAYQELVDAKANAFAAKAELEGVIAQGEQVLFDTAPSMDGWIYVPEEIRIPLSEAIQEGQIAATALQDKSLSSVADFDGVTEKCREAIAKINSEAETVKGSIKLPEPVIPLDENGNPIVAAPAPEPPAVTG